MHGLFLRLLLAHLVADWFLQNEWQAVNKISLQHPAAYVHSGIHFLCTLLASDLTIALIVFVTHILIDTRKPLQYWRKWLKQTQEGPVMLTFGMWQDQAAHLIILLSITLWVS